MPVHSLGLERGERFDQESLWLDRRNNKTGGLSLALLDGYC